MIGGAENCKKIRCFLRNGVLCAKDLIQRILRFFQQGSRLVVIPQIVAGNGQIVQTQYCVGEDNRRWVWVQ